MSDPKYRIEREALQCILIEEGSGPNGQTERRMPYSLRTEAYSLGILNRIHDEILTGSVQEIRAKRAKDLAAFIEEAFSKDVPNIEKFSIMKEKIELLMDATIAELRPNSSSPFGALNTNPLSIL